MKTLRTIEDAGFEAWFVGGCVRDSIMGRPVSDVDIATSAAWQDVARACEENGMKAHETGTKHGTVTIVWRSGANEDDKEASENFEVTTYRADGPTSDSRHPDSVEFLSSIEEDLKRRDFTINAMAWHPERGLLDPFGGLRDIERKVIETVGDPNERFREDALRILRACRFSSQLGFEIDPKTFQGMLANKHLLSLVSMERTTYELDRFLLGDFVHDALMETVDVISFVIPELTAMKGFEQITQYHIYDVLEHTAWAVQFAEKDRLVRWAALCHDMGKPAAAFFDKDGVEHFYGHAWISAMLAKGVTDRFLMSNSFKAAVVAMIERHSDKIAPTPSAVRRALARIGGREDVFRSLLALKRADMLAHAPEYRSQVETVDNIEDILDKILTEGDAFTVSQLEVDGNDVLGLGVDPGPIVGNLLQQALDAVIDGEVPNDHEALLAYLDNAKNASTL